jgi:hypothetical protein
MVPHPDTFMIPVLLRNDPQSRFVGAFGGVAWQRLECSGHRRLAALAHFDVATPGLLQFTVQVRPAVG